MTKKNKDGIEKLNDAESVDTVKKFAEALAECEELRTRNADLRAACDELAMKYERCSSDLEIAIRRAVDAEGAKLSFLSNMSHEIRTPMNAIKGMSDLLLLTRLDDIQRGYAQSIANAGHSLMNIINDMLDFSRIEADKLDLMETIVDFGSLVTDLTGITNLKASEKGLAFLTRIDPLIPSSIICDELRLKQILLNLLDNAIKFTDAGTVKLTIACKPSHGDTVELTFVVEDTGVGISEEDCSCIFLPFTHTDDFENRSIEGAGLGLSITATLVEKMGGHLEVRSQLGMGSAFSFAIKVRASGSSSLASTLSPLNKRALLVSDEPHASEYGDMLKDLGVNYDIAATEDRLLELLDRTFFTHVVYRYDLGHRIVTKHMERLPEGCVVVAVKDIRAAARQNSPASVEVLFEPVLVTGMARTLNIKKAIITGSRNPEQDIIGFFSFADVHILLVDDNEINLLVESELLRQYGIEPDTAESARCAFDMVENTHYDIIFMDHMMPEINGIEATQMLRDRGGWLAEVPIVALTANALTGMKETYLACGMNDFISKPIEISELNRVLIKWLPDHKIVPIPKENRQQTVTGDVDLMENLSEKLDVGTALSGIGGSQQAYLGVIRAFLMTIAEKIDNLRDFLKHFDYDRFRIDIHSCKSSLFNIGAIKLSERAADLEVATISKDYLYIGAMFPDFAEGVLELRDFLRERFPLDETTYHGEKMLGNAEVLRDILTDTLEQMDSLEHEEAMTRIEAAIDDSYGQELDRHLLRIRAAIESFNYDLACDLIQAILRAGRRQETEDA
ncbi:response regulator [Synergistaceae bacterium OttesenSCG-928-I11]|nr:response regulator [Synergistaceae bacterium OttesenSCG-928-I11]